MNQKLILLRGLPGAGKSSLANSFAGAIVCEADHWFEMHNDGVFDGALLGKAHSWCQLMVRVFIDMGLDVVVSNTSTTEKEVEDYSRIAAECNVRFVSLVVENRHEGTSIHGVPDSTLANMRDRFSVKL